MGGWEIQQQQFSRSPVITPHYNYQPYISLPPTSGVYDRGNNQNMMLSLINNHVGRHHHHAWQSEEEMQNSLQNMRKEEKKRPSKNEPSWVTKILQYEYIAPHISDNWWKCHKNLKNEQHCYDRKDLPMTDKNAGKNKTLDKVGDDSDKRNSFVRIALKKIGKIPETKTKPKKLEKKERIAKVDGSNSISPASMWASRNVISETRQGCDNDSKLKNYPIKYSVYNPWHRIRESRGYQSENRKYSLTRRYPAKSLEG